MKRIILLMAFMVAGMATAQITNIDKLRLNDIEEKIANDMVLTVDATGLVAWKNQTDITPDMSAYYTKTEIDAFLYNLTYADIVDAPTALSQFTNDTNFITIGDVPVYTEGVGLDLVGGEFRVKQSVLDEITANTNKTLTQVTAQGNTTDIKIKGSSVFTNTADEDYAQIKNVNDAGHSLKPLQAEMKIALMAKDGTTVLSEADLSWLETGDLAITIDDTDPENPELVFTQGGLEVARIPASTLLTGVARSADLSGYKIQFKDGANTVVYSVDLQSLFDTKQDKLTATGDVVISGSDLIDLKQSVKDDIALGKEAHSWGNHANEGYATETFIGDAIDDIEIGGRNYIPKISEGYQNVGSTVTVISENELEYTLNANTTTSPYIHVTKPLSLKQGKHTLSFFIENLNSFEVIFRYGLRSTGTPDYSIQLQPNSKIYIERVIDVANDTTGARLIIWEGSTVDIEQTLRVSYIKLEKGNKATDWTPALEDQVTDFLQEDEDAFDYLKNRDLIATKQNLTDAIGGIDFSIYYNKTEIDTRFLRLETDQTVEGAITFTQNITVPTPVNPNDAVNKKYVDDLITDFIIIKNPDNTNDWLELNDFARGWVTPNVYVEGTWKGTDNPSQANIKIPANWSKTIILN